MRHFPSPFRSSWVSPMLFGLIFLCSSVAAWEYIADSESLGQVIGGDKEVLVAFVMPNEPKSSSLEPAWLSAVADDSNANLVSVDCAANKATCEQHKVSTYPSILLFKSGKVVARYQGPYSASVLLRFVARWKLPAVSEILTVGQLDEFKAADEIVFVAFLDPQDTGSLSVFAEASSRYRDEFLFGVVTDGSIAESQDVKIPWVVCYRSVDGETLGTHFEEASKLDAWIKKSSRQVLGELTVLNRQRLVDRGWPMVYLFAPTDSERQDLRKSVYKFAKNYYDSLTCVLVDPLEFPELMTKMGLEEGHFPAGAVHQLSKDRVYPYPKDKPLDANAIQRWGLDVYQGRVKPWTSPGVTTTYEDLGPTRVVRQKVSIRTFPGMKIKIAGHDEL